MVSIDVENMSFSTPRKIRSVSSAMSAMSSSATTSVGDELDSEVFLSPIRDDQLVTRFLSLLNHSDSSGQLKRLVHRAVHMFRTCGYAETDIATVLAMGSLQYERFLTHQTSMSCSEKNFIILTHLYLAHCLALDECCKLSNWHRYLFASYCDLRSLNKAIGKILKKLDYHLFIDSQTVCITAEYILSQTQ